MEAPQRTTELFAEGGEEEQSPEAQAVHTKKAPELPNQAEVAAHDTVHCPYRSWCTVCVAASGKEDAHARSASLDVETGLLVLSLNMSSLRAR